MEKHLSEKLLDEIKKYQFDFEAPPNKQLVFIIREYFCKVHRDAVLAERMAMNKKVYVEPNFEDK